MDALPTELCAIVGSYAERDVAIVFSGTCRDVRKGVDFGEIIRSRHHVKRTEGKPPKRFVRMYPMEVATDILLHHLYPESRPFHQNLTVGTFLRFLMSPGVDNNAHLVGYRKLILKWTVPTCV